MRIDECVQKYLASHKHELEEKTYGQYEPKCCSCVLRIWCGDIMRSSRPPLFWKRKFEPEVIVTCVRWYLRFA